MLLVPAVLWLGGVWLLADGLMWQGALATVLAALLFFACLTLWDRRRRDGPTRSRDPLSAIVDDLIDRLLPW